MVRTSRNIRNLQETFIKSDVLEDDDSNNCSSISFDVKTDTLDVSALSPKRSLSPKKVKKASDGPSLKSEDTKGTIKHDFTFCMQPCLLNFGRFLIV